MKHLVLILMLLSPMAFAEKFSRSGNVEDILIRPSMDVYAIVYVDGFASAGTCGRHTIRGRVILVIPNGDSAEAMYSMALSSYLANKPIKVVVNDNITDSGNRCIIQDMRLNSSF